MPDSRREWVLYAQHTVRLRRVLPPAGAVLGLLGGVAFDLLNNQAKVHAGSLLAAMGVGTLVGGSFGVAAAIALYYGMCARCGQRCQCCVTSTEAIPLFNAVAEPKSHAQTRQVSNG